MFPSSLPFCLRRGLFVATGGIFFAISFLCLRRVTFLQQLGKWAKEPPKPMVFGFPFVCKSMICYGL